MNAVSTVREESVDPYRVHTSTNAEKAAKRIRDSTRIRAGCYLWVEVAEDDSSALLLRKTCRASVEPSVIAAASREARQAMRLLHGELVRGVMADSPEVV